MKKLLLELFSEEIPAMMQKKASEGYFDIFNQYLNEHKIKFDKIEVYVSTRRVAIHITGLPEYLDASREVVKGPKVSAPLAAINGFCNSHNITQKDLSVIRIKDIEFYSYEKNISKKAVYDIFLESLSVPIAKYVWPKSMYWGDYDIKWVRPLRNILCVFDKRVVPFRYGHLIANDISYGHRFASPDSQKIIDFDNYKKFLEKSFVMLDHNQRRLNILEDLKKNAKNLNLFLKEDNELLDEVCGLVEMPKILFGKINEKFLSLPKEILITAMKTHQKYFSLFDSKGNFAPYFLFVSNVVSSDYSNIISGNEKVLSARLEDALFFYNQDIKTKLGEKSEKLNQVIFHAKLGTLKEKTIRLSKICKFLYPGNRELVNAALLSKSDIVSEIVGEFPNLQGVMGYYYAKNESLDENIAVAIRNHYKPQGPSDNCPTGLSATLALADKIDSLCGLILAKEKPTGSKDPFALRRQALGIIRIIVENKLDINIIELIKFSSSLYQDKLHVSDSDIYEVINFIRERIKYFFKAQYSANLIASVLDITDNPNVIDLENKFKILENFLSTDSAKDLIIIYKRASNILGNEEHSIKIDKELFKSEYENALYESIENCKKKINGILYNDYQAMINILLEMNRPISNFFENVMIKDNDTVIQKNRMSLLENIRQLFYKIADFSKL